MLVRSFLALCFLFGFIACNSDTKGKQWTDYTITVQSEKSPVRNSLRGIATYGNNICWLSGAKGSICKTEDGGVNWIKVSPPDSDSLDFRDVAILNEKTILLMSAGFPCRIYKSSDAGINWKLVYENLDSASFLNSIAFRDNLNGLAFGDKLGNRHLMLITRDGGDSWERINDTLLPVPLERENGYAASGSSIALLSNATVIGLGGEKVRVFIQESESKWKARETEFPILGEASGLYALASDENQVIAVGGDYTLPDSSHQALIISEDNTIRFSENRLNGYRSGIAYCSASNTWIAVGTNGIDFSLNGDQWNKIGQQNLNTIAFFEETNTAIAASGKGEIYRILITAKN